MLIASSPLSITISVQLPGRHQSYIQTASVGAFPFIFSFERHRPTPPTPLTTPYPAMPRQRRASQHRSASQCIAMHRRTSRHRLNWPPRHMAKGRRGRENLLNGQSANWTFLRISANSLSVYALMVLLLAFPFAAMERATAEAIRDLDLYKREFLFSLSGCHSLYS